MYKLYYSVALGIGLILRSVPADACSCIPLSTAQHVHGAAYVFSGTVASRRPAQLYSHGATQDGEAVLFRVERVYKGKTLTRWLEIGVPYGGSACGYYFLPGKKYLVLAIQQQAVTEVFASFSILLNTSLCSGNQLFSAERENEILQVMKPPFVWQQ